VEATVFAKNLERVLAEALGKSDISPIDFADIAERFESLRSYGKLPRGREPLNIAWCAPP